MGQCRGGGGGVGVGQCGGWGDSVGGGGVGGQFGCSDGCRSITMINMI